jgi:hypothetical protein
LYLALSSDISQESLNHVAVWCIGEYGDYLVNQQIEETSERVTGQDIINLLTKVLNGMATGICTKQLVLTALFKLSDRLGPQSEEAIKEIITSYKNDINMEIQQRACEYSALWATEHSKRKVILERIPALAVLNKDEAHSLPSFQHSEIEAPISQKAPEAQTGGILDLFGPTSAQANSNVVGSGGILDLFGPVATPNNNMAFNSPLGFGNPLGNPMSNPLGNPMSNPLGNPMANPLGNPMSNPLGGPMGNPLGNPMGNPLGSPLGSPLGFPLGPNLAFGNPNPLGSPMGMMGQPLGMPLSSPVNNNGPLGDWFTGSTS